MRRLVICLMLTAIAANAAAWSDHVNRHFCDTVVRDVWSDKDWERCIGDVGDWDQVNFCEKITDEDTRLDCLEITGVLHPAEMPNMLGEDDLEHPGDCPIVSYPERNYLCATNYTALERARFWLNASEYSATKCERIYTFCVAANYMAQTYNPFNFVRGEDANCKDIIYRRIDDSLRYDRTKWGFDQSCAFRYKKGEAEEEPLITYLHTVNINERHIDDVIENLTVELRRFYAKPFNTVNQPEGPVEPVTPEPEPVEGCQADTDCAIVSADCCGCSSGGRNMALPAKDSIEWDQKLGKSCKDVGCPAVIAQDVSCYSIPHCVGGECVLEPDPQKLCGNLDIKSNCEVAENKADNTTYGMACQDMIEFCGWKTTTTMRPPRPTTTVRPMPIPTTITTTTTTMVAPTQEPMPPSPKIESEGGGATAILLVFVLIVIAVGAYMAHKGGMLSQSDGDGDAGELSKASGKRKEKKKKLPGTKTRLGGAGK